MPCIHGSSIMMHGQNILHAVHSWLIHHGTWSKHFACPSFMAQEMDVQQHTSMIRNTAAMLSSTAKQIVDRSRDYQWLLDHYSIQPRCPQPHSNALAYTFGTKSRRAHAMDIGTPRSIFTLQKKTFYNHLFFYYHQVWIGKDQSDQSQNGHFCTPMTTEPMLSTEKEGLLHNIVNISFYGKLLFFTTITFGSGSTHHGSVTE